VSLTLETGDGSFYIVQWPIFPSANQSVTVTVKHTYESTGTYAAKATVVDSLNNSVESSPIVLEVSPWKLHLHAGWNLISMPFIYHNYTAATMGLMKGDIVVKWNSTWRNYTSFIVGVTPAYLAFPIEDSTGYWVYSAIAKDIALNGSLPPATMTKSVTVPAGGGWVLTGFAGLSTQRHASDVPTWYTGGSVVVVVAYDPILKIYRSYIPRLPPSDFAIVPGAGYWVYVTASGWMTYPT
jgi:hypothetical protein